MFVWTLERLGTSFPREPAALPPAWATVRARTLLPPAKSIFQNHGTKLRYRMRSGWLNLNKSIHSVARSSRLDIYHQCALNLHAIWQQGGSRPRLGKSVHNKHEQCLILQRPGDQWWGRFNGTGLSMSRSGEGRLQPYGSFIQHAEPLEAFPIVLRIHCQPQNAQEQRQ